MDLTPEESDFVRLVLEELEGYRPGGPHHHHPGTPSVLVFPPLPSRLRFLVHRTAEESRAELSTFSVGRAWSRRVVLCPAELRGDVEEENGDPESNHGCSVGEAAPTASNIGQGVRAATPSSRAKRPTRASKRPDRALYTPQAARSHGSFSKHTRPPEPPTSLSSCSTAPAGDVKAPGVPDVDADLPPGTPHNGDFTSPPGDIQAALIEVPKVDPWTCSFSMEQNLSNFAGLSLGQDGREEEQQPEEEEEEEGGCKEEEGGMKMAGSCDCTPTPPDLSTVTTELTDEIFARLKEADGVVIEYVRNDYSAFETAADFHHVIEIYDFPAMFKTEDLVDAFIGYSDGGMKITWVDDTHALAVFSSETAAHQALTICHPLLKTRTILQASKQSQAKASRRAEFIQPVKERPKTDAAVARRMVARALGLQRGRTRRY